MESTFKDQLHIYRDAINNKSTDEATAHQAVSQAHQLAMQRNFNPYNNPSEKNIIQAELQIFEIQKQKQQLMDDLHHQLQLLDSPEQSHQIGHPEGYPVRTMGQEMQVSLDGGQSWQELSLAELVTDHQWGIQYNIRTDQMPRQAAKQYLVAQTRSKLEQLLNDQILYDVLSSQNVDQGKRNAYQALMSERQRIPTMGHVVEGMVKNIIAKESIQSGLGLQIETGDVYDDVQNKIDFIIKKKYHSRSVNIEEGHHSSLGIQFTINTNPKVQQHKNKQIRQAQIDRKRIEDLVLVALDKKASKQVIQAYRTWSNQPTPGGPDKLLSNSTKKQLFKGILQNMFSEDELETFWQEAHPESNNHP